VKTITINEQRIYKKQINKEEFDPGSG